MNKKLFLMPALLLGALLMFAPGCGEDDPCKDVACGSGVCIDGSCDCDAGYELGASGECDTEMRTKFIGSYNSSEICNGTPFGNYSNAISASGSDVSKIIISNFGDSGQNATATVDGTDVTLDAISLNGFPVTGSGSINGNVMTFTYSFSTFNCVVTMTKI